MNIKILGTGCPNCNRLEANTRTALAKLGLDANVEKVQDITEIMQYGVMRTPALAVDEQVVLYGRVPSPDELADLLRPEA